MKIEVITRVQNQPITRRLKHKTREKRKERKQIFSFSSLRCAPLRHFCSLHQANYLDAVKHM